MEKYILAIDQGTTGTTTILCNRNCRIISKSYRELKQIYPNPGWVEHDPEEIWKTVVETVSEIIAGCKGEIVVAGITNQRETTVIWDKTTGNPIYNAIVWQCRRTSGICERYRDVEHTIRNKTGLTLDAYFSATKIRWILEHTKPLDTSNLAFGTIDTWLLWKLTGGKIHATDYTNASRTLLFNIQTKKWDSDLLNLFEVPHNILPVVKNSIDDYGVITGINDIQGIPVFAVSGDQQSALFGQACFYPGQIKNTYGTGSFMVMNTGDKLVRSDKGLLTTVAVGPDGLPCYAVEGSVFIAGAAVQWLRDELGIISSSAESESLALSVTDNNGVYMVPAFVGLGAPHWDMNARGVITGLTRGSGRAHIARAALESIAFQSRDVLNLMEEETGFKTETLMVDGGASANNFLMQFQSDVTGKKILRPSAIESTSLGAAMMAGLRAGIWKDAAELESRQEYDRTFEPQMGDPEVEKLMNGWKRAIRQVLTQ